MNDSRDTNNVTNRFYFKKQQILQQQNSSIFRKVVQFHVYILYIFYNQFRYKISKIDEFFAKMNENQKIYVGSTIKARLYCAR